MKSLISLLDFKFVLTLESHISLDWKFQFMLTYTSKFATLQFLGSGGDSSLEWWMFFILVIILTILVLMTMSAHKGACTQCDKQ